MFPEWIASRLPILKKHCTVFHGYGPAGDGAQPGQSADKDSTWLLLPSRCVWELSWACPFCQKRTIERTSCQNQIRFCCLHGVDDLLDRLKHHLRLVGLDDISGQIGKNLPDIRFALIGTEGGGHDGFDLRPLGMLHEFP